MDVTSVVQLVSNVGFPIVACGYFAWQTIEERKSHKDEVDKLSTVVESNTLVLQRLLDKMGVDDKK